MFTGIVEELGQMTARDGARFTFAAARVLDDGSIGGSIAVDGCCLTVIDMGPGWWAADVVDETLARTTLGDRAPGDPVNLERPLRLADRLGGHLVQGHVDAVGVVVEPPPDLAVRLPAGIGRYVVEKGSVAVDGCSLTVARVVDDSFTAVIVPHTSAVTTLGTRRPGNRVNIEVDIVAKYVERLAGYQRQTGD
ncbi:MAG: riboflavin synthase [Acidimicrobiales bacterium]